MATCKVYAFKPTTATTPVREAFKSYGMQIADEWTRAGAQWLKVRPRQCGFLPAFTSTTQRVCARLMRFISRSGYFWRRIDTITARMTLLRNIARQVGISGTFVSVFPPLKKKQKPAHNKHGAPPNTASPHQQQAQKKRNKKMAGLPSADSRVPECVGAPRVSRSLTCFSRHSFADSEGFGDGALSHTQPSNRYSPEGRELESLSK